MSHNGGYILVSNKHVNKSFITDYWKENTNLYSEHSICEATKQKTASVITLKALVIPSLNSTCKLQLDERDGSV